MTIDKTSKRFGRAFGFAVICFAILAVMVFLYCLFGAAVAGAEDPWEDPCKDIFGWSTDEAGKVTVNQERKTYRVTYNEILHEYRIEVSDGNETLHPWETNRWHPIQLGFKFLDEAKETRDRYQRVSDKYDRNAAECEKLQNVWEPIE